MHPSKTDESEHAPAHGEEPENEGHTEARCLDADVCMPFIVKLLAKMHITIWVKLAATYHEILNKIQEQIDLGMLPSAHWRLYFKGKDLSELTQPLKGLRKSLMASDTQEAVTLNMVFREYGGGKTPQTQKRNMKDYFVKQTTSLGAGWCHD